MQTSEFPILKLSNNKKRIIEKKLKFRNCMREFSNYDNYYVKNDAKSCCFDGTV